MVDPAAPALLILFLIAVVADYATEFFNLMHIHPLSDRNNPESGNMLYFQLRNISRRSLENGDFSRTIPFFSLWRLIE